MLLFFQLIIIITQLYCNVQKMKRGVIRCLESVPQGSLQMLTLMHPCCNLHPLLSLSPPSSDAWSSSSVATLSSEKCSLFWAEEKVVDWHRSRGLPHPTPAMAGQRKVSGLGWRALQHWNMSQDLCEGGTEHRDQKAVPQPGRINQTLQAGTIYSQITVVNLSNDVDCDPLTLWRC